MEAFEVSEWKGFVAWLSLMAVFAGQLALALSVLWPFSSSRTPSSSALSLVSPEMVSYLYHFELLLLR